MLFVVVFHHWNLFAGTSHLFADVLCLFMDISCLFVVYLQSYFDCCVILFPGYFADEDQGAPDPLGPWACARLRLIHYSIHGLDTNMEEATGYSISWLCCCCVAAKAVKSLQYEN